MATENLLQDPNYRPPMAEAVPLGIQHVLAMFAGNITVPLHPRLLSRISAVP